MTSLAFLVILTSARNTSYFTMVVKAVLKILLLTMLVSVVVAMKSDSSLTSEHPCSSPLGVADGTVKDNMMRASSSFSSATVGAENGRVGWERGGGAWCPASLVQEESKEWLEVELAKAARVTGLATQGRWAAGQGQEFAEWVRLQWWSEEEQQWVDAGAPMAANKDTYTKVEMQLEEEVVASKLRILPVSQHPRMVCLRVELLGCKLDEDDEETVLEEKEEEKHEQRWEKPKKAAKKVEGDIGSVEGSSSDESLTRAIVRQKGHEKANQKLYGRERGGERSLEDVLQRREEKGGRRKKSGEARKGGKSVDLVLADHHAPENWLDTEYMGMAVGVLVTVILILVAVIAFILYKNSRAVVQREVSGGKGGGASGEGEEDREWSMVYGTEGGRWGGVVGRREGRGEEVYSDISSSTCHSSPLLPSTQQASPPQQPPQAPLPWGSPALYSKSHAGTLGGYSKPSGSIGKMNGGGGIYNSKSTASYSKSTGGWGRGSTSGAREEVSHYAATDLIQWRPGADSGYYV